MVTVYIFNKKIVRDKLVFIFLLHLPPVVIVLVSRPGDTVNTILQYCIYIPTRSSFYLSAFFYALLLTGRKRAWALACAPFDPATFQIHRHRHPFVLNYCKYISAAAKRDPLCTTREESKTH